MNTIEVLWQDNEDLEYKIKDQREIVEQINNHLHDINVSYFTKIERKLIFQK